MSQEFDDDAQDIPAAVTKSSLISPKLIIVFVVIVLVGALYFWARKRHEQHEALEAEKRKRYGPKSYAKKRKESRNELAATPTSSSLL